MKKLTAFCLCLVLLLGLAACNNASGTPTAEPDASTPTPTSESTPAPTQESTPTPEAENTPAPTTDDEPESGRTLVVYFSATGNTEAAASYIAALTSGDLVELEPVEPYTSDDLNWTDSNSRVTLEHEDESLRDVALVADTVDNWDAYDRVFIGYPIWWGIAAWPVNGFVEANDFTGKTVIPFCTSSSSGLGESGQLLADLAGTGNWLEGHRFSSNVSESDVQAWLDSLTA